MTLTPTETATKMPTGAPTWTATRSPTVAATPTPQSSTQLEEAQRHQFNGSYPEAIAQYQSLLAGSPEPEQAKHVRYRLAESYLLDGDYAEAIPAWEEFLAEYPGNDHAPQAMLMLGRAWVLSGDCAQALPHFRGYLASEALLADIVYEWIGDCHAAAARGSEALAAYQDALSNTEDSDLEARLREKLAGVYLTLQEYESAVTEYDALLAMTKTDAERARVRYLAGQALALAGQLEAAHARYQQSMEIDPEAEFAYLSLLELVEVGVEVDEFQRGLISYHAGSIYPEAYVTAVQAFDRFLESSKAGIPHPNRADEALYYKALAQRAVGRGVAAYETLETLVTEHPDSQWVIPAWLEKGSTQARLGNSGKAVAVYREMAALFPEDDLAPQALWRAAKLREGENSYRRAAELYEELDAAFPRSEEGSEVLWRAGLARYRADDLEGAKADWEAILERHGTSAYRGRSLYWLGKLQSEFTAGSSPQQWEQLISEAPHSYYALRAQQVRAGESPTTTRFITAPLAMVPWKSIEAETEVLAWLGGWSPVLTTTRLIPLPDDFGRRPRLERGLALASIGLRREAIDELNAVRAVVWDDPVALTQLAFFLREEGFHGLAARCAIQVATLWPHGSLHEAPLAIQRLAYPLVYSDLLSEEALARDLDPLLLAALIRQESLFEPVATSSAGARGLGQVMPGTGRGIAQTLGITDFSIDDLYRPSVSIHFGAHYLAAMVRYFDGQFLVALAAYNGGPGNARRWLEASGGDVDLFAEVITASESQRYLRRVYEGYVTYEGLYQRENSEGQQ
jgi:soluble lytic murein transglycosylase